MANEQYTSPNMSRSEEIVQATIDGAEYNKPSQSRLETLLIELKEAVEAGSGESSDYATALSLTIDSSTYVITARLLNKDGDTLGTAQTIDLPIESVVVSGSYDSQTKKVILTLQSGSTIEFSVADLVSGLQTEITSNNKLSADLVDDTNTTHKFVTASDKTTWNNKQNVLTVGTNLDDEPIEDSTNPITSGGVYNTVGNLDAALDSLIMSLEPKTITANGTYDPTDDGVDGYSEVTVNVPAGSTTKLYKLSTNHPGVINDDIYLLDDNTLPYFYIIGKTGGLSSIKNNLITFTLDKTLGEIGVKPNSDYFTMTGLYTTQAGLESSMNKQVANTESNEIKIGFLNSYYIPNGTVLVSGYLQKV